MLEFRLLGDVAVLADERPLDLGGTRQRSVLALLVLQRSRTVSSEWLSDRLWPDDQPLSAIKTVQVYVSRIRHALGAHADRLVSSSAGYRLVIADDELDAARFERGLRQARETLASGSPESAGATLEAILELWSGPALGDLAGEQFARREAERLDELHLQAVEELFEIHVEAGEVREAVGDLRRLVGEQPGRERLWRLLMLALYGDGRQAEALQVYHDARRYLSDELGLDPSPELQELQHAILTQAAPRPKPSRSAPVADVDATAVKAQPVDAPRRSERPSASARRVVTVLRADVVQTSDADIDPEVLEEIDRHALSLVSHAVERHGGTIYQVDQGGATAIFGLAITREDDALRAVRSAYELTGGADVGTVEGVDFRLGLATGEVLTGPSEGTGPLVTGQAFTVAAGLALRANRRDILLAPETERLVRGSATTDEVPAAASGPDGSTVFRLLALSAGEAIPRRTTSRFVGRDDELAVLLTGFARVRAESAPGLATVIGAPGVGKSRLVAEALARLTTRARIVRSRCLPYGDGITYWPVRELVLAASGIEPGEPSEAALRKLESLVADVDPDDRISNRVAAVAGLSDETFPAEEVRWAVRRTFEALAAHRPLVLLVDDLQWAEPALVDLLEHVLDLGRGPILLVTIARPELEDAQPRWLARSTRALIRLEAMSDADAITLLDHLAPELPAGAVRSRILAAAEGNPLFVEQLVAYVADAANADARRLDALTEPDLPIPPTIQALLAARLDRLPPSERRVLERAAVIGRTFWLGAMKALSPDDERAGLTASLAGLARRELIRPDRSDFADDEAFRFRHLLIRDAAYAALRKADRAELHARFADWLEPRSSDKAGEYALILGHHLEQAYRYRVELGADQDDVRVLADRALAFIAPSGQAAEERGDPHAAVSLLQRAVDLTLPGGQRIGLLLDLRGALRTAGERELAGAADAEAVTLLAEHPDEGLRLRRRLADARFDFAGTVEEASDAYAHYDRAGDREGMIRALDVIWSYHALRGEFTEAMATLDSAMTLAIETGRHGRAADFASQAALVLPDSPIPIPEALDRCARYLEVAGESRGFRAAILLAIGLLEALSGTVDHWRRRFEVSKDIIDDLGLLMPLGAAVYPMYLGQAELASGEPQRTVDLLRWSCLTVDRFDKESAAPGSGRPTFVTGLLGTVAPLTAQTLLAVGQLEEVEKFAYWGRDLAIPEDLDAQSRWRIAISGLRTLQGRYDEAVSLARESVALLSGSQFHQMLGMAHQTLATALRAASDEAAAVDAAHEAERLARARQDRSALRTVEAFLAAHG